MDTPNPVDMNKMAHILRASKDVMKRVEGGNIQGGHIDGSKLVQEGLLDALPAGATPKASTNTKMRNASADVIKSSGLPDVVKKAMLENPIPKTSLAEMSQSFSIDDIPDDLLEKPIPAPQFRGQRQVVSEGQPQQPVMGINMTENALRGLIKDVILEVLLDDYTQKLNENTIKKTINMLIKEGKISTKKKVVKS
jgi:hypothetical protein